MHAQLDDAIAWLGKLVSHNTVSSISNLALIDEIETFLSSHDIQSIRLPSDDKSKSGIIALIGPSQEGGIVLSGHTDVVPVEDQIWHSEPFTLTTKGNKLHGRGTCDMKGFISCCLAMVPHFKQHATAPMILAFSYDEEVGCLAAQYMADSVLKHYPKPAYAVIGEPTNMQPVTAHKGIMSFHTVIRGYETHSSLQEDGVECR